MTDGAAGTLTFLPWLRAGLTGAVTAQDGTAGLTNRAVLPVTLALEETAIAAPETHVLGPGDVVGIDARQVIRLYPPDLTSGHETTHWPCVEFDDPTLPWLFTPAAPSATGLRPWITLVVCSQEGATLAPGPQPGMTVLTADAAELPDLADVYKCAHAQIAGPVTAATLASVMADHPERTLSRLLCDRDLQPGLGYLACVVPTFAAGRDAALGVGVDPGGALEPAWTPSAGRVTLPVYLSWRFTAATEGGDFQSLAAQLRQQPCPATVGTQDLMVSDNETLVLSGLLASPGAPAATDLPGDVRQRLADACKGETDLALPLYGSAATGATSIDKDATGWFAELNLDPRRRVAAALGAAVVRRRQEDLVAAAWEQVGDVRAVNGLLDRARLARGATASLHRRHLEALDGDTLVQVVAPARSRLRMSPVTLQARIADSPLPDAAAWGAFRRLTRPRWTAHAACVGRAGRRGRFARRRCGPEWHGDRRVAAARARGSRADGAGLGAVARAGPRIRGPGKRGHRSPGRRGRRALLRCADV